MSDYIERAAVEHMLEAAQFISDGEYCGYCTEDVRLSEIPAADVAPVRWISANERLPKEGEAVLVIANGMPGKNISLVGAYELATWWSSDGWTLETWPEWEGAEITHWMPLPEPPEDRTTK